MNKLDLIMNSNINKYGIYDKNAYNVAVHIRRGDLYEKEYWKRKLLDDEYYLIIMKYLFDKQLLLFDNDSKQILFHIYTEKIGFNQTNFERLLMMKYYEMFEHKLFNIKYHISIPLNMTFHGFVISDAFIMSRSALSWSAGVLSKSLNIYYIDCINRPLNNWNYVTLKGTMLFGIYHPKMHWFSDKCRCISDSQHNNSYQLHDGKIMICHKWTCKYSVDSTDRSDLGYQQHIHD